MECEPLSSIGPRRSAASLAGAGVKFVSFRLLASTALSLTARIAIPVVVLNGVSAVAFAQDATWVGATSDWNSPSNWNSNSVPTGTATFNPSSPTTITFSAPSTAVQNLSFNAPGYTFWSLVRPQSFPSRAVGSKPLRRMLRLSSGGMSSSETRARLARRLSIPSVQTPQISLTQAGQAPRQ